MKNKEEWIRSTLESFDTIEKEDTSADLTNKLLSSIPALQRKAVPLSAGTKWLAAAIIVLLIGLNALSVFQYRNTLNKQQSVVNPVYKEYFSYLNTL